VTIPVAAFELAEYRVQFIVPMIAGAVRAVLAGTSDHVSP
jgi:hypothetical protein